MPAARGGQMSAVCQVPISIPSGVNAARFYPEDYSQIVVRQA